MTSNTHTPGPWTTQPTTRPGNGSDWLDLLAHDGPFPGRYIGECTKKDAALICAAPELLRALESVVTRYAPTASPANDAVARMWRSARAAIARAHGDLGATD